MDPIAHRWLPADSDRTAEIWVEPSQEARFLLKYFGWLVSPDPASDSAPVRGFRNWMVAPFTQLTFFSFDLQYHLFEVLHLTRAAKFTHATGMAAFVLVMLVLAGLGGGSTGIAVLAGILGGWYVAVAAREQLTLWGLVSVAGVVGLGFAAWAIVQSGAVTPLLAWLALPALGAYIAAGHVGERRQPPRAFGQARWADWIAVHGAGLRGRPLGAKLRFAATIAYVLMSGIVNESWAAPRLLPYTALSVMFRAGYAPERWAVLKERAERAWAHGDPALDYVGIGGPSYLRRSAE